jgi:large subunit ribosomal protein L21
MKAIVEVGGSQYQVTKGDVITTNSLDVKENEKTELKTLATIDGDQVNSGKGKVTATVVAHTRGDKVIASTYKRRKGYHKKKGHRQALTELKIESVSA